MERRHFLATCVGVSPLIAGCTSDGGSSGDGGNGGDGDSTETDEESLEDYVELLSHEFKPTQVGSGILLEVTVENVSDSELDLVQVDSNLYVDNERVDDGGLTIGDLPAGVTETDDMGLVDTSPDLYDEITNYDITISTRNEDLDELEQTYEFDEFDYPPE